MAVERDNGVDLRKGTDNWLLLGFMMESVRGQYVRDRFNSRGHDGQQHGDVWTAALGWDEGMTSLRCWLERAAGSGRTMAIWRGTNLSR